MKIKNKINHGLVLVITVSLAFCYGCNIGKSSNYIPKKPQEYQCRTPQKPAFGEKEKGKLEKQNKLITRQMKEDYILDHCRTQFEFYVSNGVCTQAIHNTCLNEDQGKKVLCEKQCGFSIQQSCKEMMFPDFKSIMSSCPVVYQKGSLELIKSESH